MASAADVLEDYMHCLDKGLWCFTDVASARFWKLYMHGFQGMEFDLHCSINSAGQLILSCLGFWFGDGYLGMPQSHCYGLMCSFFCRSDCWKCSCSRQL